MAHRPTTPDRRGFTLVELVLVMLIIGVIGAIAMPRFAQATARQQLSAAANRVTQDIEKARHYARATSSSVTLTFNLADNSYSFARANGEAEVVQIDESPYSTAIAKAKFNDQAYVSFNGYGIPSSAGEVVLSSSAGSVTITMDAGGRVSQ